MSKCHMGCSVLRKAGIKVANRAVSAKQRVKASKRKVACRWLPAYKKGICIIRSCCLNICEEKEKELVWYG